MADIALAHMIEMYRRSIFGRRVLDSDHLRIGVLDGLPKLEARCPGCGVWGEIDEDQLHGRVSTEHDAPSCGYHELKWWHEDHTSEEESRG